MRLAECTKTSGRETLEVRQAGYRITEVVRVSWRARLPVRFRTVDRVVTGSGLQPLTRVFDSRTVLLLVLGSAATASPSEGDIQGFESLSTYLWVGMRVAIRSVMRAF